MTANSRKTKVFQSRSAYFTSARFWARSERLENGSARPHFCISPLVGFNPFPISLVQSDIHYLRRARVQKGRVPHRSCARCGLANICAGTCTRFNPLSTCWHTGIRIVLFSRLLCVFLHFLLLFFLLSAILCRYQKSQPRFRIIDRPRRATNSVINARNKDELDCDEYRFASPHYDPGTFITRNHWPPTLMSLWKNSCTISFPDWCSLEKIIVLSDIFFMLMSQS